MARRVATGFLAAFCQASAEAGAAPPARPQPTSGRSTYMRSVP